MKKKKTEYLFIYCICFENGAILISSLFVQFGYGRIQKKQKRPVLQYCNEFYDSVPFMSIVCLVKMHIFLKTHEAFQNSVPKPIVFVLLYYTFFNLKIQIFVFRLSSIAPIIFSKDTNKYILAVQSIIYFLKIHVNISCKEHFLFDYARGKGWCW